MVTGSPDEKTAEPQKKAPRAVAAAKKPRKSAKKPALASYIQPAPKGPRRVSHARIVKAVEAVFRARNG